MRIWLALLIAPVLALSAQSIMYALVTPSCAMQTRVAIHAVALVSLLLAAWFTGMAHGLWRRSGKLVAPASGDSDGADPPTHRHFLAGVASAVGALSCLVILTMWMAAWVLSPCWS
jgi:hypothetical protein